MPRRKRTAKQKQVDAVTEALAGPLPNRFFLNSSTCAACGFSILMKRGKNGKAYYVHGHIENPSIPRCVNADKVFLAEPIELEVIDPGEYAKYGVEV